MGQCKYTQTAIYKGVPKAVGGKKKSVKILSDIWKENERPLKCIFYLMGKWHWDYLPFAWKEKTHQLPKHNIFLKKDS